MFFFWYCFDDALAAAVNAPGLGHLPWWVVLCAHLVFAPVVIRK